MRWPLILALVFALSATGAWADRYSDCNQNKDRDRRIRGCTQIIERGEKETRKSRGIAYINRGVVYARKGDKVQAIANYRMALEINPSHQNAKNNLKALGVTP